MRDNKNTKKPKNKGFTLVELAIVIVIIGLLVGGVLQGAELITQSKIRAQIKKFEEYDSAILIFKAKYNFLPGDMPYNEATRFGFATNNSATVPPNGDGLIGDDSGRVPPIIAWPEPKYFFTQLWQAKLIKDQIAIVPTSSNVGESFPFAAINNGGFAAVSNSDGGLYYLMGPNEKVNGSNIFSVNAGTPYLSPEISYVLDSKLDDGIPSTGIVKAIIVTNVLATQLTNDTTLNSCLGASNQVYNLTTTQNLCKLIVRSKGV